MNRQKVVLTVLLVIFACSLVISYLRMPRQKRVEKQPGVNGMNVPVARQSQGAGRDEIRVRLELLEHRPSAVVTVRRNLFSNLFASEAKKPIIPLPPPPPPPPPPMQVELPKEPPPPLVAEPTPLQREMARFTFLGFMKKDNKKTIFLTNDKEIFVVKKGDRILGKYDVSSLTEEALTISSLQDGGEIIIPLVENRPLQAPKR